MVVVSVVGVVPLKLGEVVKVGVRLRLVLLPALVVRLKFSPGLCLMCARGQVWRRCARGHACPCFRGPLQLGPVQHTASVPTAPPPRLRSSSEGNRRILLNELMDGLMGLLVLAAAVNEVGVDVGMLIGGGLDGRLGLRRRVTW